jgi:NAD(P)-dependent dehydrogenase (short-subunit alcohol dehydrogenase family)
MVRAALITGASRGIGAATALLPAKQGYRLVVRTETGTRGRKQGRDQLFFQFPLT